MDFTNFTDFTKVYDYSKSAMMRISSSHSLEFKDPSPFRDHELRSSELHTDPLYTGWIYDTFNKDLDKNATSKSERSVIKLFTTVTHRCLVYFARWATYKAHLNIADNSQIVFWSDVSSFTEDADESIRTIIREQYKKYFPSTSIVLPHIDVNFQKIQQFFAGSKIKQKDHRIVFHYCGYSPADHDRESLIFSSKNFYEEVKITQVLQTIGDCCTLIIDDDYSGNLLKPLIEYVNNSKNEIDIVAFFSCQSDEVMPLSKNFPTDIFTSCMTTPGRMALVNHSRNYFCFSDSALQPIPALFMNNASDEEKDRIEAILADVRYVLNCTVEAMAFRLLPKDVFDKLFRSDKTLENFTCNFILACRILSAFNITPVSYPELPDMTREPEWSTFDLRLDTALSQIQGTINSSKLCFSQFLEGACKSISYVLTAPVLSSFPPLELSFVKIVIQNGKFAAQACDALAVFLNNSSEAIEWSLHFDIFNAVYNVLEKSRNEIIPSVLFCVIKMLAYCPDLRDTIPQTTLASSIEHVLIPLLQANDKLIEKRLALITLVLLLHNSPQCCRQALRTRDLLKAAFVPQFPTWSMHLINCIAGNANDSQNEILDIVAGYQPEDIELQLCVVSALGAFIQSESSELASSSLLKKKNFSFSDFQKYGNCEKKALKRGLEFAKSTSYIVRREVLILFSCFVSTHKMQFLESQKPFYNDLKVFFANCLMDPSPSVRNLASSIEEGLKNDEAIALKSNIVDCYLESLLDNISQLLADSSTSYSKILTQTVGEVPTLTIRRNVSLHHLPDESEMRKMKIVSTSRYQNQISSNLIVQQSQYFFGDEKGCVSKGTFNDGEQAISRKIADDEITSINHQSNYGYPLLFAATNTGKVYSYFVADKFELTFANAFCLPDEQSAIVRDYQIEVNPWTMHMFSYYKGGNIFEERDLRTGKKVSSIAAPDAKAVCFKPITKYADIIALAGESLCIFDTRASTSVPVITRELDSPVFEFDIVDDNIPSFSICSDKTSVGLMDSRYPNGMRTVKLWISESASEQTKCFGTNKELSIAALGYENGLTCVNLVNGQQRNVPNISISFASSKPPNPARIAMHAQKMVFVNEKNELVTVNM